MLRSSRAPAFGAVVLFLAITTRAFADERNCPLLVDQVVHITAGQPVTFRLAVTNADASTISIFQYPLGGVLDQIDKLIFTFVPGPEFGGTTTFTYRLTPPVGCGSGAMLGKVTLVGGPASSTAQGLPVDPNTGIQNPPEQQQGIDPLALLALLTLAQNASPCGLGGLPFFMVVGAALVGIRRVRRGPHRRDR